MAKKKHKLLVRGSKGALGRGRPKSLKTILEEKMSRVSMLSGKTRWERLEERFRRSIKARQQWLERRNELQRLLPTLFAEVLRDGGIDTRPDYITITVPLERALDFTWRGEILKSSPKDLKNIIDD